MIFASALYIAQCFTPGIWAVLSHPCLWMMSCSFSICLLEIVMNGDSYWDRALYVPMSLNEFYLTDVLPCHCQTRAGCRGHLKVGRPRWKLRNTCLTFNQANLLLSVWNEKIINSHVLHHLPSSPVLIITALAVHYLLGGCFTSQGLLWHAGILLRSIFSVA